MVTFLVFVLPLIVWLVYEFSTAPTVGGRTVYVPPPMPQGPDHYPFAKWQDRVHQEFDAYVRRNGCCGQMDDNGNCLGCPGMARPQPCYLMYEAQKLLKGG